jgi:hypothetical protein
MKTLDAQHRLEYARATLAVIRALQITDKTMSYDELARAIGLMTTTERWQPWHRQQLEGILQLVTAAERDARRGTRPDVNATEIARIVAVKDGPSAKGVHKHLRVVRV